MVSFASLVSTKWVVRMKFLLLKALLRMKYCQSINIFKYDSLGKTLTEPKLQNRLPLARLEVRKSTSLLAAHPKVPLLWKNNTLDWELVVASTFLRSPRGKMALLAIQNKTVE